MDPKQTVSGYADQIGVGPNDSSTLDKSQQAVSQGIETIQKSVFGQKSAQQEGSQQKQTPHVPEVDEAHPTVVEGMLREKHRSEPVTGDGSK